MTKSADARGRTRRWLIVALLSAAPACYPNPDDLRHDANGSGGQSDAGTAGASGAGGVTGTGGRAGAAGGASGGSSGAGGLAGGSGGSGGSLSGQCGAVPPCGGNLVGNWAFILSCSGTTPGDCAGEVLDSSGVRRGGTLTLTAAGTYSTTETDTGTFIFTAPTSCLGTETCADLQTAYQGPGFVGQPNPKFSSATCSATGSGCRCLLGALGMPVTETGVYSTSGSTVTSTASVTGNVNMNSYCTDGTILHMIYPGNTPSNPDEAVFMKQ